MPGKIGMGMTPCQTKLGKFIRACRLKLKLKQQKLAKISSLPKSSISAYEIGRYQYISFKSILKLALAFKCDPKKIQVLVPSREQAKPQTELAKLIRYRREELGLTRQQFAEKAEYHPMTIGYLETRGQKVSGEKVRGLVKALQLDLLDFKRFIFSNLKETKNPLGQVIRFRRLELGLSLRALAEKIGKTPQYISLIELGQIPLSENKSMIKRIAKALDMDSALLEAVRPKRKLKIRKGLDPNTLGGFITQKRLELSLPLKEIAERAKTTGSALSRIEINKYNPGPELLARIANALECEIPESLIAKG